MKKQLNAHLHLSVFHISLNSLIYSNYEHEYKIFFVPISDMKDSGQEHTNHFSWYFATSYLNRGFNISFYVLLKLLNKLGKRDKMPAKQILCFENSKI